MWKKKKRITGLSMPPEKWMSDVMATQSIAICTRANVRVWVLMPVRSHWIWVNQRWKTRLYARMATPVM